MAENYFGITDTGRMRSNNEDTFIAEQVGNGKLIAACVIDGVGGYSGGEVASRLGREAILQYLEQPGERVVASMNNALLAANQSIFREKQLTAENDQMACVLTLALVDLQNNKFHYAHVGDTRLYLFRDQSLVKISHDHSFVGFLEDSGRLNEEEAMGHPKRNEINKALGFDGAIEPNEYFETGESPFLPGDILLLCSDGLTDLVNRSGIASILSAKKSLAAKAKMLVQQANEAGGKDNITVVLVHNNKPAVKQVATKAGVAAKKENLIRDEPLDPAYVKAEKMRGKEKKSSGAVPLLSVLLILLLGACLWLLYQYYQNKQETPTLTNTLPIEPRPKNERELRLIDSINNPTGGQAFVMNMAGDQPLYLTDSIALETDSLHIVGNGITLVKDSAHHGPAFVVSENAKYILLDSLTLENFDVALIVKNNAVQFRNVVFKNCRIPVQYNFLFPTDVPVNGSLLQTVYNADTLLR